MNDATGRHPVNIGHLVMGLVFAGLLGIWALITADVVAGDEVRWLFPLPWVLAGGIGLLAVMLAGRRKRDRTRLGRQHDSEDATVLDETTEEIR